MTNPTQHVYIVWEPQRVVPTNTGARGTTGGYFVATMPELNLYATGGSHSGALNNLMTLVAAAPENSNPAINSTRFW